jgi:phospholipase C
MDSKQSGTRRQFFIEAAQRLGGAGLAAALLASVQEAAAIEAEPGSTFLDAEHVVVLMQENRSFDHVYGALRGVRGFNDPRAVTLPDQSPVWMQKNAAGEAFAPFHLDIQQTNATWLGSLPHSWRDQTDACSSGNNDQWLVAKKSGRKDCADKPLTLGYYDRSDLPFYYALADAFTICDQNFCSSLTGTTPNRLYLWTGTVRDTKDAKSEAMVRNSDVTYSSLARWTTFPERLEDAGVSWKIYQNELSLPTGLSGEQDAWLANFTDNPIEWFEQYGVFYSKTFREYAKEAVGRLPKEIAELEPKGPSRALRGKQSELKLLTEVLATYTDAAFAALPDRNKRLHAKAFQTNEGDPDYRKLTTIKYRDGATERSMQAPKGDVLYQFRKDVADGTLPAVSWLVPPERFSDHPGAPWYGAWMLSEVLRILTAKPEVWKKTIFILTYDENDGYFDHVPPFRAPDPGKPESGKVSDGIDAGTEYWPLERDRVKRSPAESRGSSIGLGFRVPMVVASPWSRGGNVCSQVFDHTSVLQLLEKWLTKKTGKPIAETNISAWRRAVCGDMTAVFQPATQTKTVALTHPAQQEVLEGIHKSQFKELPGGYQKVTRETLAAAMPKQERGMRPSLPLPYELYAAGGLLADGSGLEIQMSVGKTLFGTKSSGSAFHVYAPRGFRNKPESRTRAYAVEAGKSVKDVWALDGFTEGNYGLCICGPNGFLRELHGGKADPKIELQLKYVGLSGNAELVVVNHEARQLVVELADSVYRVTNTAVKVGKGERQTVPLRLQKSSAWYDFTVTVRGIDSYKRRFAGRVETGKLGQSDPAMAG